MRLVRSLARFPALSASPEIEQSGTHVPVGEQLGHLHGGEAESSVERSFRFHLLTSA
jgi:hypothetical protein